MPLINCEACGREISVEAESCPQCGHPNRVKTSHSKGPKCYACSATATMRCQKCGTFSCVRHLQNVYVSQDRGGSHELRCDACYESAKLWNGVGWAVAGIFLIIFAIAVLSHIH